MSFPAKGDFNTYKGTVLMLIESSVVNLRLDIHVTEIYGTKHNSCTDKVRGTLRTITFSDNSKLKSIHDYAFKSCRKLGNIDLSPCKELEYIGRCAFWECSSIKNIILPKEKLNTIQIAAFKETSLTELYIPKCVSYLGSEVLSRCWSLVSLVLDPEINLTKLPNFMISNTNVVTFTIPKNIQELSEGVFQLCFTLSSIQIAPGNTAFIIKNEALVSTNETIFFYLPLSKVGTYTVPDKIVVLNDLCFKQTQLSEIILPDTVISIRKYAFSNSESLSKISFSNIITYIGVYSFYNCTGLTELKLPDSLKVIGEYAFNHCTFSKIIIPNNVTTIGAECFTGNPNLMHIIVPDKLETIGGNVFPENDKINISFSENSVLEITQEKIIMDKKKTYIVQYMGNHVNFVYNVPKTITTIKKGAFRYKTNLSEIIFPQDSELETIMEKAFELCSNLKDIKFPEKLATIGVGCFRLCTSFTKLAFGKELSKVYNSAFEGCTNIEIVDFRNTKLEFISLFAFYSCKNLTTVKLSNTIVKIMESAFSFCNKLNEVNFMVNGGLSKIGVDAFRRTNLTYFALTESSTVSEIESSAFRDCVNLHSFVFSNSVKKIGFRAFENTALESVTLSQSVSYLDSKCFSYCDKLTTFIIPENSQLNESSFGLGIFIGSKKFSTIESKSSNFKISFGALLSENYSKIFIFPPASPIKFLPIPDSVKHINNGAFMNCENIESIIITKDSVSFIGISAFEGCTNLRYISIPQCVVDVGKDAFKDCNNLFCGISVESENNDFIENLFTVSMLSRSAVRDCKSFTCKNGYYRVNLRFLSSIFFFVGII